MSYKRFIEILFAFLLLNLIQTGCKRDDSQVYTISGKVVKSCDNPIPISNLAFELWYYSDGKRDNAQKGTGVTDANGNFSINYSSTPGGFNSRLELITSNGPFGQKPLLSMIPQNKNLEAGNIYTDTNYFLNVIIRTEKNYTDKDTLFFSIANGVKFKFIKGPFINNQFIDTVSSFYFDGWNDPNNRAKRVGLIKYEWKIGANYADPKRNNQPFITVEPCRRYNEVLIDLTKAVN
ncbi:MAG: hypothetical protein FGM41_00350 [Bacteroidetes bacterium]|nr:hypothetical protein [Bacteroidota bacterium]